jgi:tetratricopeptide (TPR) repeat protein
LTAISLSCSDGLPGAEDVNPPEYLARVEEWAAVVRRETPKYIGSFRKRPHEYQHSQAFFRASMLVQILKKDLGVRYNLDRKQQDPDVVSPLGFFDSRDVLIHGPLGPTRMGTCNNIPMVVVAVGRKLGYPVHLAANAHHVYVKWVKPSGQSFVIEASNVGGMITHPEEYFRTWPIPMTEAQSRSGYYLRAFTPKDELALCLVSRAWVLETHRRYGEALEAYLLACVAAPEEPMYPRLAGRCAGKWLRETYNRGKPSDQHIRRKNVGDIHDPELDPRDILEPADVSLALSVLGRYYEVIGRDGVAAAMYGEAVRWSGFYPGCLIRLARIAARIAYARIEPYKPVVPLQVRPVDDKDERRFCLGLRLGYYAPGAPDEAAAARASRIGDRLATLNRMAEAMLAYGEAVRLDWNEPEYFGKRRWTARAHITRWHAEELLASKTAGRKPARKETVSC